MCGACAVYVMWRTGDEQARAPTTKHSNILTYYLDTGQAPTDEVGTTTTAVAAGRSAPVRPTLASDLPPGWTLLTPSRQRRRDAQAGGSPLRTPGSTSTSAGARAGGGGLLTPRKIGFEGGPGKRGNRYQALSGEGASEDEYEAYPYEDESSALLYGGG